MYKEIVENTLNYVNDRIKQLNIIIAHPLDDNHKSTLDCMIKELKGVKNNILKQKEALNESKE